MSKLFYTSHEEALYMMRRYDVRLNVEHEHDGTYYGLLEVTELQVGLNGVILIEAISDKGVIFGFDFDECQEVLYIHPESLSIFEPQVGDLVQAKNDFVSYVAFIEDDGLVKCNEFPNTYLKNFTITNIIQRNGKPFFMPQREE